MMYVKLHDPGGSDEHFICDTWDLDESSHNLSVGLLLGVRFRLADGQSTWKQTTNPNTTITFPISFLKDPTQLTIETAPVGFPNLPRGFHYATN